jgi:hypothetical protein
MPRTTTVSLHYSSLLVSVMVAQYAPSEVRMEIYFYYLDKLALHQEKMADLLSVAT